MTILLMPAPSARRLGLARRPRPPADRSSRHCCHPWRPCRSAKSFRAGSTSSGRQYRSFRRSWSPLPDGAMRPAMAEASAPANALVAVPPSELSAKPRRDESPAKSRFEVMNGNAAPGPYAPDRAIVPWNDRRAEIELVVAEGRRIDSHSIHDGDVGAAERRRTDSRNCVERGIGADRSAKGPGMVNCRRRRGRAYWQIGRRICRPARRPIDAVSIASSPLSP